jgi:TRAP-type C4-dicarboxylate transport system permease small subunit
MNKLLAQTVNFGGTEIKGPLDPKIQKLGDLVSIILSFIIPLSGVILLFVLIWGGYDYMMSQGNPEKIKSAQGKITTGIIGFFLLIGSYLIVRLITGFFGLNTGGIL